MKFTNSTLLTLLAIAFFLHLGTKSHAQAPADEPCNAPIITPSEVFGQCNFSNFDNCCFENYSNFRANLTDCSTGKGVDKDAWFKIGSMQINKTYNFLYIEKGHRETMIELYELPVGKDCSNPNEYIILNRMRFYPFMLRC